MLSGAAMRPFTYVLIVLGGAWCLALILALRLAMVFLAGSVPMNATAYLFGIYIPVLMFFAPWIALRGKKVAYGTALLSGLLSFPLGIAFVLAAPHYEHPPGNPGVGVILIPLMVVWFATLMMWAVCATYKKYSN